MQAMPADAIIRELTGYLGDMGVASLSVRKIDDEILVQLRVRAARHGVSMEEEARRILKQAVAAPERLGDLAVRVFSPAYGGTELDLPEREVTEPLEFPR
jgi:plasmid stability protein